VYLHYVFDLWIEAWRQKVATGDVIVVRYADDLVVGFENRMEAERFLEAFRERLAKFGLELHPEKTRLIEFGRSAAQDREKRGEGNRRPLRSWASRITAGSAGAMEHSSSGGKRPRSP
jgi:RNA-directed DNA polymerase